jgi:PAS domain S-box-containing protein
MTSFLGVPIVSHGQVLGNLYLTEKRFAKEFTDNDARLVELLARHAAVAIENARLYAAIDQQQQRLQLIVDQFPEAIIVSERSPDRISLANRKTFELLGWNAPLPISIEEFFARNQRLAPDGSPLSYQDLAVYQSLASGTMINRREVRIVRPDGRQITVLVNSAPVIDQDGRVTAAISVFQDITQIKDAEQLKDDFLSLVSHELRTPLTTIQGGSMLLLHGGNDIDDDVQRETLSDISNEARRLGTLIENMVQLANIRAGRMVMETELVHVRKALERAAHAERPNARGRELRIESEPNLFALADPSRLDQLVRNLIHNALKYAPGDTPIDISARRVEVSDDATMIEIAVRDYGPGITDEDLPYVFERFRRSRQVVASGLPGMGLGLYLARHLVEAHGGHIWVERPSGGGARVSFTIPEADELDEDE